MSCDNIPTTVEIAQAKKDIHDLNTFMTSDSNQFVTSTGVVKSTLTGVIGSIGIPSGLKESVTVTAGQTEITPTDPRTPLSANLFVNGKYQNKTAYSVSGGKIVLNGWNFKSGEEVEVIWYFNDGPIVPSSGVTFYLSDYAGTSLYIEDAWAVLLATMPMGYKTIVIDANPNSADGGWLIRTPCRIPNDCTVDYGYTLITWDNESTTPVTKRVTGMFYAIGTVTSEIDIASDIAEGSNKVQLTSVTGVEIGDYLNVEIVNAADQTNTTTIYPIIYDFAKVLDISGTTVTMDTVINWNIVLADQDSAKVKLVKNADCVKNIVVKNFRVVDDGAYVVHSTPPRLDDPAQPDYVIGPLFFQYCDNVHVIDAHGSYLKCPLVQFREYTHCSVDLLYSYYPLAINSGEGYTVQMSRGSHGLEQRCGGYRTRHVCDFTSGFDLVMRDCWDDTPVGEVQPDTLASFLLHGRFESEVTMSRLRTKNAIGLGAGFDFGNWIKNWSLCDDSSIGEIKGRGAVGVCSIRNSYVGTISGTSFWEKIVLQGSSANLGLLTWARETRLPSPRFDNGIYVTAGSLFRASEIRGFDNFVIDDTSFHRVGGAVSNQVQLIDVASTKLGGEHYNCAYKMRGTSAELIESQNLHMEFPNDLGNDGAISASAITVSEIRVTMSGRKNSTSASPLHRPFKFQQGSGIVYNIKLDISGLKITGSWSGGGQVSNLLTVEGVATGNLYEGLSVPTFADVSTNLRLPWPATFRSYNNYHTDESRNFDNVGRSYLATVDFGIVASNTEQGVVLSTPGWMDVTQPAHVNVCFSGIVPANVSLISAVRDSPVGLIARLRNLAATSQNIGSVTLAVNYSVINE